ncbi:MAG: hypothetical protein ACYDEV_12515 [Acidiferrobacter sp.]
MACNSPANHKVGPAMIPTPLVGEEMARGAAITVVTTTAPIPIAALSAASWIPAAEHAKLRQALLNAPLALLQAIGFRRFVLARAQEYRGAGPYPKGILGLLRTSYTELYAQRPSC